MTIGFPPIAYFDFAFDFFHLTLAITLTSILILLTSDTDQYSSFAWI